MSDPAGASRRYENPRDAYDDSIRHVVAGDRRPEEPDAQALFRAGCGEVEQLGCGEHPVVVGDNLSKV